MSISTIQSLCILVEVLKMGLKWNQNRSQKNTITGYSIYSEQTATPSILLQNQNRTQKNTITTNSVYSHSRIVPKERALKRVLTWINHFLNSGVLFQVVCNGYCTGLMLPHSYMKCLQSTVGKVTVKWTGNWAKCCGMLREKVVSTILAWETWHFSRNTHAMKRVYKTKTQDRLRNALPNLQNKDLH